MGYISFVFRPMDWKVGHFLHLVELVGHGFQVANFELVAQAVQKATENDFRTVVEVKHFEKGPPGMEQLCD